ncbi:MAG: type II toxin-antitoxin system VapC family toxin [Inquilinaceae bacterium]
MTDPVLLDTCAAIWLMNGDGMSGASLAAIRAAQQHNVGVYVSPITAWEIGVLVAKNRLALTQPPETWFAGLLAQTGVRLADLSPSILIRSSALPQSPPSDPADRMIIATAREGGFTLITRDRTMLAYAAAGHARAIAC